MYWMNFFSFQKDYFRQKSWNIQVTSQQTETSSASSNQHGANSVTVAPWHTKSRPWNPGYGYWSLRKLHFSKIMWQLVLGFLTGSSMECHEKKCQPFSLFGVQFGSQAILISGWKSAWCCSGRTWAFQPCLLFITCSNSQCKTHQIAQIGHFKLQKRQYTTTEVDSRLPVFWALTWTLLDISLWYDSFAFSYGSPPGFKMSNGKWRSDGVKSFHHYNLENNIF